MKRRNLLKYGLAAPVAAGAAAAAARSQDELKRYLAPPDGFPPQLGTPSPYAEPFAAELFVPPVKTPVPQLDPLPDPAAHQLYEQCRPRAFYELREEEFLWQYHPHPPYANDGGSLSWGFDGVTPGPVFQARYGEPILVRRFNDLPPVGVSEVTFALPSTSTHLHNGHTASESDGSPQDWIDSGEFWDHHYANFPSGQDPREKLTTLWYHDHRLDYTAANVYAGLSGFYSLFDEHDTGFEDIDSKEYKTVAAKYDYDPKNAWRLPSGEFDVPLMLHDVLFDETGQVVFNGFQTDGWLGDQITVNRRIRPHFKVQPRKYRFRIIDGGPSRFYELFLRDLKRDELVDFVVLSGDGNMLPEPIDAKSIYMSVAQRVDVIIDFSKYEVGDHLVLENHLLQDQGQGPSGRTLDRPDGILRFDVVKLKGVDKSRIPATLRPHPKIDLSEVRQERTWAFGYAGGLWNINGLIMDPNRIDAAVEQGSAEIWTFRNSGNAWSHPIHCHFTEFMILEVNGRPYNPRELQTGQRHFVEDPADGERQKIGRFMGGHRRDVATLLPGDEVKVFMRFSDFLGKYVMHCHNVVHEDHSMMIRWDIVPPGKGFLGSRPAAVVYGADAGPYQPPKDPGAFDPPYPDPRPPAGPHLEERPAQATYQDG
jgi:FtsP/CotA-like multicopper oxidase with cupredoxin domain